jgi:hypothetical protein
MTIQVGVLPEGVNDLNEHYLNGGTAEQLSTRPLHSESNNTPLPVMPEIQAQGEFPIDSLGVLTDAAKAIAELVQVPESVAGLSVLTTAALAAQGHHNACLDGRVFPLSLFALTILDSGDRKSASDKIASAPIAERERELLTQHKEELQRYQNAKEVYEAERKEALSDKSKLQTSLDDLTPPDRPPEPNLTTADPTIEGLQKSFKNGRPSQGLFTAEGATFFGGHGMSKDNVMKTIAGLSVCWDGGAIRRTRGGEGESFTLYDRRLSAHIMIQPAVAGELLSNPLLKEQGFIPRFLVNKPVSLAGSRLYNHKSPDDYPQLVTYNDRILSLLRQPLSTDEHGGLVFNTLLIADDAKEAWIKFYNEVERRLSPDGELAIIKESASKIAEQAIRIAGVLCAVEGAEKISIDHMSSAIELADYFLTEQLRLAQTASVDLKQIKAGNLDEWIRGKKGGRITIDELTKNAPRPTGARSGVKQARALMKILVEHGRYNVTDTDKNEQPNTWEAVPDANA